MTLEIPRVTFRPSLQAQQRQIQVRSYVDLVNALGRLIAMYRNQTAVNGIIGYEIVIADSFLIPRSIILQRELSGIKITSLGRIPIIPLTGTIECMFDIRNCDGVTIEGLYVPSNGINNAHFKYFVKVTQFDTNTIPPVIQDNHVVCNCLYYEKLGTVASSKIIRNSLILYDTGFTAIDADSAGLVVDGNTFGGGEPALFGGSSNRIVNNNFVNGDITTLGDGTSKIIGNVGVGGGSSFGIDVVL